MPGIGSVRFRGTSRKPVLILARASLLVVLLVTILETNPANAQRVGGRCEYTAFSGKATITQVTPVRGSQAVLAGLPYRPRRVLFTFSPSTPVANALYEPGRQYELTLSGGTPPGPGFLKKYGIRPGAAFTAKMDLIRSGTCTPVVFTFRSINLHDFFELQK